MALNTSYKKSNFGGAFFFLSKEKRKALGIIYDFCRAADDIADDGLCDAKERLKGLRAETALVFEHKPLTPLGAALSDVADNYPISKDTLIDLIDGVERDLQTPVRFETIDDLKWYTRRVAGAVGLMCIEIFGYSNPAAKNYAVALGHAVQLTNIARDICEDAKINRIYIPKEDLERFSLTEEDILNPAADRAKLQSLLLYQLERAADYFQKAAALLPKEDFAALLPARAMGNIYLALLKKLRKNPCPFGGKKIKLSKLEKVLILFQTWRENP
jgi:phytoene synthase